VTGGAKFDATGRQFHQNGECGVYVVESTMTAHLTNCTSHHNKVDGVCAQYGAVVDLMGEGTSVHDNERFGLSASSRGTINVYQPCVLNKRQNIYMELGGTIQQKDSKQEINKQRQQTKESKGPQERKKQQLKKTKKLIPSTFSTQSTSYKYMYRVIRVIIIKNNFY